MTAKEQKVPDGKAEDVTKWVGEDPSRAMLALRAENTRPTPRLTLIQELEKVAYDPDGLYEFVGHDERYYPGYRFVRSDDGDEAPAHATPGQDPIMFICAGGQDLPIPPRDGNWVPAPAKMAPRSSGSGTNEGGN